jgi:hypothetical protein
VHTLVELWAWGQSREVLCDLPSVHPAQLPCLISSFPLSKEEFICLLLHDPK